MKMNQTIANVNRARLLANVKNLEMEVRNSSPSHITENLERISFKISETNDILCHLLGCDVLTTSQKEDIRLQERRLEKVSELMLGKVRASIGR